MPWRPIQTATAGFLSLLNLKNVGKNPDELLEQVRPTVDMGPWWLRGESLTGAATMTAAFPSEAFFPTFLRAEQTEWIYLHTFRLITFSPGGGSNDAYGFIQRQVPGGSQTIWSSEIHSSVSLSGAGQAIIGGRDLWIPPGSWFGGQLENAAVGDQLTIGALYTRVRI